MHRPALEPQIAALTGNTIPMHMPGHKRHLKPSASLPYDLDITEIEGADDLHDAGGILRDAMKRASGLWGSGRTWFLVGGSTCGILAGIRAAVPFGGEIIAARNCHRSVYHAIELCGCKVHWVIPGQLRRIGICGEINARQISDAVRRYPHSAAVILTSPTYEGVISDIRAIAGICHKASMPLIVDEAHGAHLGLFEEGGFPDSSVRCGADLVVQSIHKTLPSMTQTALLHLQSVYISQREVERQLGIFETSSPSYPLMISIDSCTGLLSEKGPALFKAWKSRLDRFYDDVKTLHYIKVWMPENAQDRQSRKGSGKASGGIIRDRSKVLISFRRAGLTGSEGAQILRERYRIETEMSSGTNVLAMTGCGDAEEDLVRLSEALEDLDRILDRSQPDAAGPDPDVPEADREDIPGADIADAPEADREDVPGADRAAPRESEPVRKLRPAIAVPKVRTACSILTAVNSPYEEVRLSEARNRICAEYLYAYPPGIPILAPGEYIGAEHLMAIRRSAENGNRVHRTHSSSPDMIACLEE